MNFGKVLFFVFACFLALSTVNAAPGNFFKDLEGAGQRVRDAIISAGPAVDVLTKAKGLYDSSEEKD
ncbi:cecropin-D-like [Helicoverpa armigera]|uniref:cecropin-D-like n=1 Tax=Helicoverpa armigera TaxID=29058 RepID=UPI003083CDD2